MCCKCWRFITWDFLPGVLDLVDLELLGPGYCVHNQKPFVTEPSPSQGAPAIVHTPGSHYFPLFPRLPGECNGAQTGTRRTQGQERPLHPFLPQTLWDVTSPVLGGRAVFLEHQPVLLLAEAPVHLRVAAVTHRNRPPLLCPPGAGVQGQCWLSSPGWQSPLLSPPAC